MELRNIHLDVLEKLFRLREERMTYWYNNKEYNIEYDVVDLNSNQYVIWLTNHVETIEAEELDLEDQDKLNTLVHMDIQMALEEGENYEY